MLIPTHNSTLALNRAGRRPSTRTSLGGFFSLEITRFEITMWLLSAEAKVPANAIRNGQRNHDD